MADPVKIKFEYQNPDNVESDVPGEQKLREVTENGNEQKSTVRRHNSYSGVQAPAIDHRRLNRRHSNISNTSNEEKIEAKKSRTKIPVSRFRQTVEKVKLERRGLKDKKEQESHIPIRRSSIPKVTGKTPTKPARKSTPVAKTKADLAKTNDAQPKIVKTEDVESTVAKSDENEATVTIEANKVIATEDEFDKLYEEVVHSPTPINIDVSLLNPKVDDPEKLESKFEEIIHDYDENRVQPMDVEKIKKSRIPFLKRKSQQEIDVRGDRSGKMIAARDKLRMRRSSAKSDEVIDGKADKNTIDKSKLNTRNHVNSGNDVKLEENNNQNEARNDATDEEINNNVFDEIEKMKCDAQNDVEHEISVGTAEAVDDNISANVQSSLEVNIAEPIDNQDKSTDDLEDLESKNKYSKEIELIIDGLEKTLDESELSEQDMKPETTNDSIIDNDNVIVEQTIDETVLDNLPVTQNSTNVNNIELTIEQIKEENIYKGSIQIGIPVFDSQVQELTEKGDLYEDVKKDISYAPHYIEAKSDKVEDKVEITQIQSESVGTEVINNTENGMEIVDTSYEIDATVLRNQTEIEDKNALMKEKDGSIEDVAKLRGKVGRLISKIDAHEPVDTRKDFGNELPKKKSVLSKIAMFERHDVEPAFKSRIPKKEMLPKLHTAKITENKIHVHTPLIVDEVFKPFEAKEDHNTNVNTVEIATNGNSDTEIVKAEMVIIESPENNQYDLENKVEIKTNALLIEESKITEEVLAPILREYEPKTEEITDENKSWQNKGNEPVIVPKFIPVKEVLKRYETINNDNHVSNKIERIPKAKPISEIIKTLKPESRPRSLDVMFTQSRPITDILNDLKPENKNEIEKVNVEVEAKLTPSKDNDSKNTVFEKTHKNVEQSKLNINKDKTKDIVFESYDKTRHVFKSYKSKDHEYTMLESNDNNFKTLQYIQDYHNAKTKNEELRKAKSLAELDLGDFVKGKVNKLVDRMNSMDKIGMETKEVAINRKELPRQRSVSEKIALFEPLTFCSNIFFERDLWQDSVCLSDPKLRKIAPMKTEQPQCPKPSPPPPEELSQELQTRIQELAAAKQKYGTTAVPTITLADGRAIPAIALGTALLDPRLVFHVVCAAIDLGYRAIDTAYIYGNERAVGEAIQAKINDGTVTRGELFIMSKLWSTFHRRDLVRAAFESSLEALGLDYIDLFMIHNPMSFKEGGDPIPKIATVLQYSEHDYMDAWFGMETLGARARSIGLSNFNAAQVQRVLDRARIKPVVNQVECHPYLSQHRLDDFCRERNITLSCYGVLGSKGTPQEYKSGQPPAIDDPLIQVMASGLNVSPAQLLIRYQLQSGRHVVVKSSSAANLWNNLQAVTFSLTDAQMDAIQALNRNKRNFIFKGMGDTHKNYPFKELF